MTNILFSGEKSADNSAYYRALERFECRVTEVVDSCIGSTDALLLGGGGDISPKSYNYRGPLDFIDIEDEKRDALELELIRGFISSGRPIFGICRGVQILAVFFGGTLIEDIPARFAPSGFAGVRHNRGMHMIETLPGSIINGILGKKAIVNSFHHQAVAGLGNGFTVSARSTDGVCEAAEQKKLPAFGVQWHPERLDDRQSLRLFETFCAMAVSKNY